MSIKEFMGHCFCSSRFEDLKRMIENNPIEDVLELQKLHKQLWKNFKYQELEIEFQKRLG